MRVLLVADVVGGVRTFTRELVRELVLRDVEVDLALVGSDPADLPELGARSCEVRDLRLEWMSEPWRDVRATGEWVDQLRRSRQPDVVHMNTFAPLLDPAVPVLLSVHSCVLTWWRAVHGTDAPAVWRHYRRLVEQALGRADWMTAPTRALLRDLTAVYGELPRASVIANGRKVARRVPPPSPRPRTRRSDTAGLVLTAGRIWDRAKNAALVVAAAPAINGRVVVIGAGATSVDDLAAHERIGPLAERELMDWLWRADVFVEPARYEPFGLAALEAALCGCALVLGDIPSLREVWGDAAVFVDPDDPMALSREVNSLLDDSVARETAARRARARASRYSPATMADGYLAVYQRLARTPVAV